MSWVVRGFALWREISEKKKVRHSSRCCRKVFKSHNEHMGSKMPTLWTYWQAAFTGCFSSTCDSFTDASYLILLRYCYEVYISPRVTSYGVVSWSASAMQTCITVEMALTFFFFFDDIKLYSVIFYILHSNSPQLILHTVRQFVSVLVHSWSVFSLTGKLLFPVSWRDMLYA